MQITDKTKPLYCEMVSYYGETYGLPPLNAKVYVYLMFDLDHNGFTFDELLERFNVSKSSLSNSLQMLTQNKLIEHYTPIDSRKRIYRINPNFKSIRFGYILDKLNREKQLMQRMKECNKASNKPNSPAIKEIDNYVAILNRHIRTIEGTVKILNKKN